MVLVPVSDSLSILGLSISLLLPWLCGIIWIYWLLRKSGHWNSFIVTGHGYIVGLFITTLIIRLWDFADLELHFWGMAAVISGLIIVGLIAIRAQTIPTKAAENQSAIKSPSLKKWEKVIISLLLGLMLFRYISLTQELILRPLFPWDAWMNWAPKAIVWYYNDQLVTHISAIDWLKQTGDTFDYTLTAWKYPHTVPLIQLWGMLGAGTSDHTLIYLPWLMINLSLGLALYGHLRSKGLSILTAILACYALLNLPYVNIHTALAGYADSWLSAAFGLGTFALAEWHKTRQGPYGLLALTYAIVCLQLKIPGVVLGAILILVFMLSSIKISRRCKILFSLLAGWGLVFSIVSGISVEVPQLGHVFVSTTGIELPYLGTFKLEYHPVHDAFIDTLFIMSNWRGLWYILAVVFVISACRGNLLKPPSVELLSVFLALFFVVFVFHYTKHFEYAVDFTSINRALLYPTASLVFYIFGNFTFSEYRLHPIYRFNWHRPRHSRVR